MSETIPDPVLWNDWHVVADATALRHDRPLRTALLGVALTVARGSDDMVAVARDDGGAILAEVRHGFVWACPGMPAKPILPIPEMAEEGRCIVTGGSIGVHASAGRVIENFLDLGHLGYVHAGYLGEEPETAIQPYEVAPLPGGGVHATGCRVFQPVASPTAREGFVVEYSYKVERPLTACLYKSNFHQPHRFDIIYLFAQPVDEEHAIAHALEVFVDDGIAASDLRAFQQLIFLQDRPILESQTPKKLPIGPRMEMPVAADKTSVAYRRWLADLGVTYGVVAAS